MLGLLFDIQIFGLVLYVSHPNVVLNGQKGKSGEARMQVFGSPYHN